MGPESRRGKICGIMWTEEKVLDSFRNTGAVGRVNFLLQGPRGVVTLAWDG